MPTTNPFSLIRDALSGVEGTSEESWADPYFQARYNRTKAQKEKEAYTVPGVEEAVPNREPEETQRYGAGYLFGKNWGEYPTLARGAQSIANAVHPFDRDVQALANKGLERGISDYYERERGQPERNVLHNLISGLYR
jgi:hypothetical protein